MAKSWMINCDSTGLFCKSNTGFSSSETISESLLIFFTFVSACSFASTLFPGRSKKSTFFGSILIGLVCVQYYHLYLCQRISYPNYTTDTPVYRHECLSSNKGGKVAREDGGDGTMSPCDGTKRISNDRDCDEGQFHHCTVQEPCMPCELDRAEEFGAPKEWSRCITCTPQNKGDCKFEPGVGPYCFESYGSQKAVPCKRCCTEAYIDDSLLYIDGVCI